MSSATNQTTQALRAVLDALRGDVLHSVRSAQARTSLLSSIRLLGRVHDEIAANDGPTSSVQAAFAPLRDELQALLGKSMDAVGTSAAAKSPYQEFLVCTASIQSLLQSSESETEGAEFDGWLRHAARTHLSYFERRETELLPLTLTKESATDCTSEPLRLKLCGYLAERFPRLGPDSVQSVLILPGGYSKQTALLELSPNPDLPARLVLRRDASQGGSTGTSVANEFPLLGQMHSAGLPVPKPLLCESDSTRIGGGFVIIEEVERATRAGELFPELNSSTAYHKDFPFELARVLAALHQMKTLPASFKPTGFVAHGDDPLANVKGCRDMWRKLPNAPLTELVDAGFAWLMAHPPRAGRTRTVVHADVGAHNILVRDGHLAALLDWELTHIGDPAEDLSFVRTLLIEPQVPWSDFVQAYIAAGGSAEACEPRAINWFSIWNHVRNCTYTGILHAQALEGRTSDVNYIAAGWDYTARLQRYLAMDLHRALKHS